MQNIDNPKQNLFQWGFLKVPNVILSKKYADTPYSRSYGELYTCLLYHANRYDKENTVNSYTICGKRGEWITTYRTIDEKTQISRSRLKTLLDNMEADGVISVRRMRYFTIITITGYDDWMKVPTAGNNPPPATPVRKNLPEHRKENFRPIYQRFT